MRKTWLELEAPLRLGGYLMLALGTASPAAANAIYFEGKTISIIVGTGTGGSTDASARLMGQFSPSTCRALRRRSCRTGPEPTAWQP
jgi:hypothetical protein